MHRIEETAARGIYLRCGACSAATGGVVRVHLGRTRLYKVVLDDASEPRIHPSSRVCLFFDESPNEEELRAPHTDPAMSADPHFGVHSRTFAGRGTNEGYLVGSSSGGFASWLVERLITEGHADAVIHVGASTPDDGELFRHWISECEEAGAPRKSQYYSTTMADALRRVTNILQRYIVVDVPCFIRAARALCRENPFFNERLAFFVALVRGHYKNHATADSLGRPLSVYPRDLAAVDFRVKHGDRTANDYDFVARSVSTGNTVGAPARNLAGDNRSHSTFQPEACNFCDDVVSETAEVSFGDGWLPELTSYPYGTNVVVSRTRVIDEIFDAGAEARAITVFDTSADRVAIPQAGGLPQHRYGLANSPMISPPGSPSRPSAPPPRKPWTYRPKERISSVKDVECPPAAMTHSSRLWRTTTCAFTFASTGQKLHATGAWTCHSRGAFSKHQERRETLDRLNG